jgi:FkbH-like protein
MSEHRFVAKVLRGLAREKSLGSVLGRASRLVQQSSRARVELRQCDSVGAGARVVGRLRVENDGRISIGAGLIVDGSYCPVELVTAGGGAIEIGESVWINFGTLVHARSRVEIGDGSHIGQYSILSDTEVPEAGDAVHDEPKPIRVGKNVWIAGRVTVLPGTTIGDGSVITAGSFVSGDIPPGVVAGGNPARVLRKIDPSEPTDAPAPPAPSRVEVTPALETPPAPGPAALPAVASPQPALQGLLLADSTINPLAQELARGDEGPAIEAEVAPFGQIVQSLLDGPSADFAVVWTRPEAALESFQRLLMFEPVELAALIADVDAFCDVVVRGAPRFKHVFVPTWIAPPWQRGLGAIDARDVGPARALLAINARLHERLAVAPNVHVLDAQRWQAASGAAFAPRAWYLGKVAFHDAVFAEAAREIKAGLRALTGQARKLLVLDLDDTLWGGIVGDAGWENLRLGGHDGEGEALVDFQRAAKALKQRGIALAIVSKNEESVALEAIRRHPEMVLREEDFVAWRINWQDKARNIAEIAAELNLGLQSVVFIDDNPVERARVREALPEVLVPEWPVDKALYPSALQALRCFDVASFTREDAERTQLYAEEKRRDALLAQVGSLEAWLEGLQMRVRAEPLGPSNIVRAAQLLNKTNQLNLSTRRLTEAEFLDWSRRDGHRVWALTVSDRFGDAGLTGLLGVATDGTVARIVDFVLSCRVMGRKVEETMLALAVAHARERGLKSVEALYLPTAKNKPTLSLLERSGFHRDGERFFWDTDGDFASPSVVTLDRAE